MTLSQMIQNDLSQIFANHITKSVTYDGSNYSAIASDLVSLNDYSNTGIFEQADMNLIFQTSSFTVSGVTTLPHNGKLITVDNKPLKINKVTLASDGNKFTVEASALKNK